MTLCASAAGRRAPPVTWLVERADTDGGQRSVVGNEQQAFAGFWILVADTTEVFWVILGGLITVQHERLVEDHSRGSVRGMRIATLRVHILLRAGDKEAAGLMQPIQAQEVDVAAIHDVKSPGFRNQLIEDIDVV